MGGEEATSRRRQQFLHSREHRQRRRCHLLLITSRCECQPEDRPSGEPPTPRPGGSLLLWHLLQLSFHTCSAGHGPPTHLPKGCSHLPGVTHPKARAGRRTQAQRLEAVCAHLSACCIPWRVHPREMALQPRFTEPGKMRQGRDGQGGAQGRGVGRSVHLTHRHPSPVSCLLIRPPAGWLCWAEQCPPDPNPVSMT